MLEILNRYTHGFTLVTVIRACRRLKPFQGPEASSFSFEALVRESGANPGFLRVVFRQMESLGILFRGTDGTFSVRNHSLCSLRMPEGILEFYTIAPAAILAEKGSADRLRPWVDRMLEGWDIGGLWADLLDGPIMVPVLLAVSPRVRGDGSIDGSGLGADILAEVERLLTGKGFGGIGDGGFRLNAPGRYLLERAPITATVFSYGPMLARAEELLFGDPRQVFERDPEGHETHVVRHLNVTGSGFQHEKFFNQLDRIVGDIFSGAPMNLQPRYVADMGCGDGTLLRRIYELVKGSTPRGQALEQFPLTMIGLDYNQQALDEAGRTLAGIPHLLLRADIGKPAEIVRDFARLGIDADAVLHVRSFLDHDRPFVVPSNGARAALRGRIPGEHVSVDADGGWTPPGDVVESLVQHLENWAAVVNRHGLVLLEVHCLAPAIVRRFLDESESLHFDAYHGFSLQHLVEAHTFRLALAEAGLFPRAGFSRRFPRTFPYTRITLDWLERREYRVRHALPSDVPDLCGLETECWPPALRVTESEIRDRLERFPAGQFVLERGGRIAAVLYSQRIGSVQALEYAKFSGIRALHDADGPVLQMLGLNVTPELSDQTLGSQLADVVFDWCRLRGDIEAVAGITRCRDFRSASAGDGFEEYVRRTDGWLPSDPILRFHASRGALIRAVVENYRPEDSDNLGKGVLIEYDLAEGTPGGTVQVPAGQPAAIEPAVIACVERLLAGRGGLDPGARDGRRCSADSPLRDLGLDSLDLMELRNLLNQQFAVALDASFFFEYSTPKAIADYLGGKTARRVPFVSVDRGDATVPETDVADDAVAIVGMSCRFPGGADSPEAFWHLLERGDCVCGRVPATRWASDPGDAPGAEFGGFLPDVDQFDAAFFRISPREANYLDPQQRILLEESWRALESAGIEPDSLRGSPTGVFIGIFSHDYENLSLRQGRRGVTQPYLATGNAAATASGRLAYFLDLRGPALSIDTACSSSLVAVHLACQSLRSGESAVALAGGVNLMLSPDLSATFSASGMLARDGRCKTFDASADGYVRSEGCAVVVLKLLRTALADGDDVLAVIRGTAVNQDGESNGLTAPNGRAQEEVIRAALAAARCEAREVSCVEAHGTGTSLGDPVEVKALGAVYGEGRDGEHPLTLGSVKTNIGHTEAAAGLAGVLKVVLALRHRRIPRHLHFSLLNAEIALNGIPARIATEASDWKPGASGRRLAGISSFGFSGTNAHLIVEEAPPTARAASQESEWQLLALSAGSNEGLGRLVESYATWLNTHPEVPLSDVCHTANAGRRHFGSRLAVVGDTTESVRDALRACAANPGRDHQDEQAKPRIAFLYTGQGSQYPGMGRALFQSSGVFRAAIERCDAHLASAFGESVVDLLYGSDGDRLSDTRFTQPAIFCVEFALTELWRSLGVAPAAVAGHSVGEFAAAVAAGVLSPEDGLTLISERAGLMQESSRGAMLAVLTEASTVEAALRGPGDRAQIAAYNAPENIVVSGETGRITELEAVFRLAGIRTVRLNTSHAFHSHLMDGVLEPLTRAAAALPHLQPSVPFVSNLTGNFASQIEPGYWARHARQPVRFSEGIRCLDREGYNVFLEIGPRPVLTVIGPQNANGRDLCWTASLRPGRDDWRQMLESIRELYTRGARIEWSRLGGSRRRKVAGLPGYPFERLRCWLPEERNAGAGPAAGSMPGTRVLSPLPDAQFHAVLEARAFADHRVNGKTIVPAAAYMNAGLAALLAEIPATALEGIEFEQPLVLTEDSGLLVQTTVGKNRNLAVDAFDAGANEWRRHATATIAVTPNPPRGESMQSIRARVNAPYEVGAFYADCLAVGAEYGAGYRLLTELHVGCDEALGRVGVGGSATATLDAALQVALAALSGGLATGLPLPFSVGRFELSRPLKGPIWSHARVERDTTRRVVRADLTLYDGHETVIGSVSELVLRFPSAGTRDVENWRDWLCRLEWHRTPGTREAARVSFGAAARAVNAIAVQFITRGLAELGGDVVQPRYQQLFLRLLQLRREGDNEANAGDTESMLRGALAAYPEAEPELKLIARCGRNLAAVLRGTRNPLELLFPNGDLADCRDLYAKSPAFAAMNRLLQQTVSSLVARRQDGRTVRILEIGGGTGAATEALLPHLDPNATAYTFTDVSSLFSARTSERLLAYPFVTCKTLDIEKPCASQGFVPGSFDIVVAANVMHATADLGVSLRHARELLAPGGALVLLEVTEPQPWIDLVFGLTEGWWRFEDRATRAEYPLLRAEEWQAVLKREGYAFVEVNKPTDAEGVYGQAVLVTGEMGAAKRTWLFFGDSGGDAGIPGPMLARLGEIRGEKCRLVLPEEDIRSVLEACAGDLAGVLYAGGADWERVLAVVHAVIGMRESACPSFWIVTRDAVSVSAGDGVGGVAQSPLWGMGRVIANEHPELRCRLLDIDGTVESASQFWDELLQVTGPREEVGLRGGERFVSRLAAWNPEADSTLFDLPDPLAPERREPRAGEVEIRVEATGLNFRDVLSATGQYPGGPVPLGVECSGTIVRAGEGVTDLQPGDEVIAVAPGCFGEFAIARAVLVVRKPNALSFEDAAGIAVPYLTAAYCLETLAGMKRGDRVLIHAAAGGVGWAASRLALRAGAEVYATANRSKWEFLRYVGIRHIYDSRSTDFARRILSDTGGEGVDIVLNSLSGEAAVRSYSLLRANGTFVELAKDSPVMSRERCRAFDLLEVAEREPAKIRNLFVRLVEEISDGMLSPPPVTVHTQRNIREAFAQMQQARHIGKIVISRHRLDEWGTYLITGGTGGLGLEVSRCLVRNGARRLVLVSRRGAGAEAEAVAAELRRAGAEVEFARADVGNLSEIARVVASIRASDWPLRGVIHAAGALDDGMIADQTPSRFRTVMEPKAGGAWNLHEATSGDRLQFFVMFSSVASLAGSHGQANHAAANAFLDSLAAYRRARGLPAIAINWGAWSEIGSAAGDAVGRQLKVKGLASMTPAEGIAAFDFVLTHNPVQAAVLPINWGVFVESQGSAPRFGPMRQAEPQAEPQAAVTGGQDLATKLREAPADQRDALLREELRDMLRKVLGMTPGTPIPARRGFFELGLDSLSSVQMRNTLQKLIGEPFPSILLFDCPDVETLAAHLLERLGRVEGQTAPLPGRDELTVVDPLSEPDGGSPFGRGGGELVASAPRTERDVPTGTSIGTGPENGREGSLVKRPLKAVEARRAELVGLDNARPEPIAIIGMGCRFPGGVEDAESYWRLLRDGVDAIREVPRNRWDVGRYFDEDVAAAGKMHTRFGGFVDGLEYFDAAFFHIAPREARSLDPQHRLLLEVGWEALENAGIAPLSLREQPVGIFAGLCSNDYAQLLAKRDESEIDAYLATGTTHSMAAGRLSYVLGSTGPNLAVDTACSSALAAVHLAIQSLRSGESTMALAGGANCILTPHYSINFCKANMLAPDGRCKSFDAAADGFVRGEGAGMVVLKRLSHALRDGDRILAVLRASAMNQDGHTSGPTVPSGPAQRALIRLALADAGIKPSEVGYIEAHGTGTSLGDPIEAATLGEVFGSDHSPDRPLFVGSVKTNLGHLEGAAGIAGLIKTVLALQHRTIPGNLHFHRLSPHIDWAGAGIEVPSRARQWSSEGPRIAGVSSFGFSGTNVHVVVQQAPELAPQDRSEDRDWHLLTISATNDAALRETARRIATQSNDDLPDVAFTANHGRSHFGHRLAIVARDWTEAAARIETFLATGNAEGVLAGAADEGSECAVVFVFAGDTNPGRGNLSHNPLYRTQAAFRAVVDECDGYVQGSPEAVLLTLQVALAQMWRSWGILPSAVRGAGSGRYAALHLAGVYSLEEALRLAGSGGLGAGTVARPARLPVLAAGDESSAIALEIGGCLPDWKALASDLQSLYVQGAAVDWGGWDRGFARQKVALPTYSFQRQRHWFRDEEPEGNEAAGEDEFAYEVRWQPQSQGKLPDPADLLSRLRPDTPDAAAENGLLCGIESLSAGYAANALLEITGGSSGVAANRRRLFGRLIEMNGLSAPAECLALQLAALMGRHPEARAELQLVARCGASLAAILTGECSSVETLFPAGEAGPDKIYHDSPSSLAANLLVRDAIGQVMKEWPGQSPLRLLEVGAGTGGTTAHLLEAVRPGNVEYLFTDLSRSFLVKARERFAEADFMRYQVLDVEKDPETQGLSPGTQDVIVAANILHATADLRVSLSNLRKLLTPGGLLFLVEVVRPQAWLDVTFGLLDGWWRFRDTDLRLSHPLLRVGQWKELLEESGFECATSIETGGASSLLRQGLIAARASAPRMVVLSAASPFPDQAPERIVCLSTPASETADPLAAPVEACSKLLDLVRRVRERGWEPCPRIWAAVRDPNGVPDAAFRGLGRVAGLECPEIWRGILHVPADATSEDVCRLAALAERHAREREIRFRDGEALTPRIVRMPLPAGTSAYRFREDGTYLITGGLGFLGLRLAKWMAARGARNLVMMGRSGASGAESKAVVAALVGSGVRVEVAPGDASRASEIRRVLDVASSMPELRGVVHMAARGHAQPLLSITRRDLEEEFGPKIGGAWALHEQTRDTALDFFVLCSSASSVWGAKGQAHYAAANSCLDLLAQQRREMGLKALSVNWGLLTGGGMVNPEYRDWLIRAGVEPLDAEDGFRALFRLIDGPAAQVLLARVNWRKFAEVYGAREQSRLFEELAAPKPEAGGTRTQAPPFREMAPAERRSALTDFVMEQFCRTLGLPSSESPGLRRGFFDAGMDSLLAIEFRNRLQEGIRIALTSTAAFNYPNVEAMAQYLDSLMDDPISPDARNVRPSEPASFQAATKKPEGSAADPDIESRIADMLQGVQAFLREDVS